MNLKPGIRIEFAFGVEQYRTGDPISKIQQNIGCTNIVREATNLFGGCTLVETRGDWINSAGNHCPESGRTLIVNVSGYNSVDLALEAMKFNIQETVIRIKHELDQEAVCVTVFIASTAIL